MQALVDTIESGAAILFTGAGFSSDARDARGTPLPDGEQMAAELWSICFGDCARDDSTLCDLYDVALRSMPDRLQDYVDRRLRVGDRPLPAHLAAWLAAPWRRAYTLNVDDVEAAIARQYELPRAPRSVSALDADFALRDDPAWLDVIHLNGVATASPAELTFSTMQYASRLCGTDPAYAALARDLIEAPIVFAGTRLDEVVLWQHIEMQRRRSRTALDTGPPSFLVAPHISRARRVLLESFGIRWIESTIEEIARYLDTPKRLA
jgi:hypothetical protein